MSRVGSYVALVVVTLAVASAAPAGAQTTVTLNAVADTSVREARPYLNDGIGTNLSVSSGSVPGARERTLVRFDQAAIKSAVSTRALYKAEVELTITNGSYGWNGGQVAIHAMKRSWSEGNGTYGAAGSQGPTWVCAKDTNAANSANNCTATDNWSVVVGGTYSLPWNITPTDTSPLYGNHMTKLRFDVTADVARFLAGQPNNGWFISDGGGPLHGDWATFASREAGAPPKLIIQSGSDLCTADPNKVQPLVCGCGVPEVDSDGDGQPDCVEPAVLASADTTLRLAIPYGNDGTGENLGVTAATGSSQERALVRVDQAQIAAALAGRTLISAELELNVASIASGWSGGRIGIHRMTRGWPEGTALDIALGAHGPSWFCADDRDTAIGLNSNDCPSADRWGMQPADTAPKPFDATATNLQPLTTSTTKKVRFVVTSDVTRFLSGTANYGWLIKGAGETKSGGLVNFTSRETGAGPVLWIKTQPKAPLCANGSPPSANGCPDFLDSMGSELALLKRLAADPATPPANRPLGVTIAQLSAQAQIEANRVIDSMPDDLALHPTTDLRPQMVSLGRAFSTLMMVHTPPLGTLPNGGRSPDTLEGTTSDPAQPLLSQLFERLAYLDNDQQLTRAGYRLADFQNLINSLNRRELVLLDEGMTEVVVHTLKRLVEQRKKMVAVAFYDQILPVALLVFDAAKYFYTPRVHSLFRIDRGLFRFPTDTRMPLFAVVKHFFGISDSKVDVKAPPFAGSLLEQLYCKSPPLHYTLARFGIWLPDMTHGGQLSRVHLGEASVCDFLSRITDFERLGAGDCSLLEVAYSGYQCRSKRTCQLAAPTQYRIDVRPGSSLSKVTHFGVAKTLARTESCSNDTAFGDGASGYLTSRPGTECLIRVDDIAAVQHPFIDCIAASQGPPVRAIEPAPMPWRSLCPVIDCEEGQDCPTDEPEEKKPDEEDTDYDKDGDSEEDGETDASCDSTCELRKLGRAQEDNFVNAVRDTIEKACGPGCVQSGWEQALRAVLRDPLPYVENHGVDVKDNFGDTGPNPDGPGVSTNYDEPGMMLKAYNQAIARSPGITTVEGCIADDACRDLAENKIYPTILQATVIHERSHALIENAVQSPGVLTAQGRAYFDQFTQSFETLSAATSLTSCHLGDSSVCSADHRLLYDFLARVIPGGAIFDCGVEGSCNTKCGANNPGYDTSEACKQLSMLIRNQYEQRIAPRCPAPNPNEGFIAAECRFPGCFDGGIPAKSACPFALCTGDQPLASDIACECCTQCKPAPPAGSTGTNPTCENTPNCKQCCIHCNVPAGSPCPEADGPDAVALPPAWQVPIGPD